MLIGTGHYNHSDRLPVIPAARNNLEDLRGLLSGSNGVLDPDSCRTLLDPAGIEKIGDVVEQAAEQADDTLIVYYTGHGMLDRHGHLHLSLPGTNPDRVGYTALPFRTIRESILESPATTRILILDCCFSGRAFDALSDAGPDAILGQADVAGTYTITSSARNEISYAPSGHRNTAFTGALIAAAAQAPGVSLDELYPHIHRYLRRHGHPAPRRRAVDTAGRVVLFPGRPFPTPGPASVVVPAAVGATDGLDSDAMNNLGVLSKYRNEFNEAERWFHRATDAGNTDAMNNLAILFRERRLPGEAEWWFRKSADAGNTDAMFHLATQYRKNREFERAEGWFRKAANAGHARAGNNLGIMLRDRGDGLEAQMWFRKAAEAGNPSAMSNLAELLRKQGNRTEAQLWESRARAIKAT
ncbi:caspase, EACC1-associated type [Nocardia takedensis]